MARRNMTIGVAIASLALLAGCGDGGTVHEKHHTEAYADAMTFFDEHWSPALLVEAYSPASVDLERSGEGALYIPVPDAIESIDDLGNLPLWVAREVDEEEYLVNAAVWLQFIFGWDDFRRASMARPEFDYEPTGTLDDLRQPWVSGNREVFRQMLVEAGVELPAR